MARGVKSDRATTVHAGTQSAEYIADLSGELAKMARRSRLDFLAYLLDIASLEARSAAGPARPLRGVRTDQRTGAVSG